MKNLLCEKERLTEETLNKEVMIEEEVDKLRQMELRLSTETIQKA